MAARPRSVLGDARKDHILIIALNYLVSLFLRNPRSGPRIPTLGAPGGGDVVFRSPNPRTSSAISLSGRLFSGVPYSMSIA